MRASKYGYPLLCAAVAVFAGCGGHERTEAVQLAKALRGQQANVTSANANEKDLVAAARTWCAGITAGGAGRGAALDQNAEVAAQLAKSAVAISAQLSQLRQAIDALNLTEEYPQHVRDQLTSQLTKRQRSLQDIRALLEESAPQFLQYKKMKNYAGDTYPDPIGKLDTLLRAYKPPEDALASALADLQEKYSFKAGEV